jgi:hypothetical protein
MFSLITSNNFQFIGKIAIVLFVVFFILNNVADIDKYKSILLSIIVVVAMIIIENIFYINYIASDPLNCEQCKITDVNYNKDPNSIVKSNLILNPENIVPEYTEEPFSSNLSELINNFSKSYYSNNDNINAEKLKEKEATVEQLLSKVNEQKNDNVDKKRILKSTNDNYNFKCIRLDANNPSDEDLESMNNDELRTLLKNKLKNETSLLTKLEEENSQLKNKNDIIKKNNEISYLETKLSSNIKPSKSGTGFGKLSDNSIETFSSIENNNDDDDDNDDNNDESSDNETELLNEYIQEQNNKNKKFEKKKIYKENNKLPNDVNQKIKKIKKQMSENNKSKSTSKSKKLNKSKKLENFKKAEKAEIINKAEKAEIINKALTKFNESEITVNSTLPFNSEGKAISYDSNYVEYQQDGLEKDANKISSKQNIFKMGIGNPNIVRPYIKDGEKYYDKIFSVSTNAPTSEEAQTNELKYGYYNYIGPLNKGMINKDYTFISPENWYPIPPHPPICVTNKECTTCPIQISDGKDYMNFASVKDFDKARRFTGSMNINTDYVKEVLNNANGF